MHWYNYTWWEDRKRARLHSIFVPTLLKPLIAPRNRRGVIFCGAGHAAKKPYRLPKIQRLAMGLLAQFDPCGSRFESQRDASAIFLKTPWTVVERAMMSVFSDTRPHLKIASRLKPTFGEVIATTSDRFGYAEQMSGVTAATSMPISSTFDYWVQLDRSECRESLM